MKDDASRGLFQACLIKSIDCLVVSQDDFIMQDSALSMLTKQDYLLLLEDISPMVGLLVLVVVNL